MARGDCCCCCIILMLAAMIFAVVHYSLIGKLFNASLTVAKYLAILTVCFCTIVSGYNFIDKYFYESYERISKLRHSINIHEWKQTVQDCYLRLLAVALMSLIIILIKYFLPCKITTYSSLCFFGMIASLALQSPAFEATKEAKDKLHVPYHDRHTIIMNGVALTFSLCVINDIWKLI